MRGLSNKISYKPMIKTFVNERIIIYKNVVNVLVEKMNMKAFLNPTFLEVFSRPNRCDVLYINIK